ncbi:MAG: hypothetical protein VXX63_05170, partial [Bacteroidota bacterium]|nr:hypothetical protein [Bacteroidota bacterium]
MQNKRYRRNNYMIYGIIYWINKLMMNKRIKDTLFFLAFSILGPGPVLAQFDDLYVKPREEEILTEKKVVAKQSLIPLEEKTDRTITSQAPLDETQYMSYEDYFYRLNREDLFDYYADGYQDGFLDAQRNNFTFPYQYGFGSYRSSFYRRWPRNRFYVSWSPYTNWQWGWNYGFQPYFFHHYTFYPSWSYGFGGGPRFAFYQTYDPWFYGHSGWGGSPYYNRSWGNFYTFGQINYQRQNVQKARYNFASSVPSRNNSRTIYAGNSRRKETFVPENNNGRSSQISKPLQSANLNKTSGNRETRSYYESSVKSYNTPSRSSSHSRTYNTPSRSSSHSRAYNTPSRSSSHSRAYNTPSRSSSHSRAYNTPSRSSSH